MRKKVLTTSQGLADSSAVCRPCSDCNRFRHLIMNCLHIFNADPCLSIDRMNKN